MADRAHFPGFESLRALAATMVVVHHAASLAGPDRAGRLATPASVLDGGVAVFFVISGFLIYRPFVAASIAGRPGPSWRAFWWRRALRIVPAYWLALTLLWVAGSFDLGGDWWRYYAFVQIYSRDTVLGGIVPAWSLCTEVAFYLVVPPLAAAVAVAGRRWSGGGRARLQLAACGLLWLAGAASRAAVERWAPSRRGLAFNWLPANLDLFAVGMAVAVVSVWAARAPRLRRLADGAAARVAPWWAAAVALLAWYAYAVGPADFATGYQGFFWQRRQAVLGLVGLLLLVPAVFGDQGAGVGRRLWAWRPVVWVGTVSYGLYLWHLDLMERSVGSVDAFGAVRWEGWVRSAAGASNLLWLLAVGLVAGLLVASASWYLVEEPLQRFKHLVGPRPLRTGALGRPDRRR